MEDCEMVHEYYLWLLDIIRVDRFERDSYRRVLQLLFATNFYWTLDIDENRAGDGLDLRARFYEETGHYIFDAIANPFCTVLEMMVALAIRCEDTIMFNPDEGDRTDRWFWEMFDNLRLNEFDDFHYNEEAALEVLNIFMERAYFPDGEGGMFPVRTASVDMRRVEIWYQLNYYIGENYSF